MAATFSCFKSLGMTPGRTLERLMGTPTLEFIPWLRTWVTQFRLFGMALLETQATLLKAG